jgi:hypothetical protein
MTNDHISTTQIEPLIFIIRGYRVLIDADLANLYGVKTKALNQAIKRNIERFPADFMFQLTSEEKQKLVTECDRFQRLKHSSAPPHALTEHGALMAANVLNSPHAIKMSVYVVRSFVKLRQLLSSNHQLSIKLDELERKLERHDSSIRAIVSKIRDLTEPVLPERRRRLGI